MLAYPPRIKELMAGAVEPSRPRPSILFSGGSNVSAALDPVDDSDKLESYIAIVRPFLGFFCSFLLFSGSNDPGLSSIKTQ